MAKLSVLYVIRNEQDLIEKSMRSIQPIADEIIVIDTGSLDKTISICRKFPYVKIFSHAWVHDFSKTKNYGIKQCTGDWILCMDADELLDRESAAMIKSAITNAKPNIAGYSLHITDHETSFDENSPTNEKSFFQSPQMRVFRKNSKIQFEGKINETAIFSAKKIGGIDLLGAKIHHFLWRAKGDEYKQGRLKYYEKLGGPMSHQQQEMTSPPPVQQISRGDSVHVALVIPAFNALAATKDCITSISIHTKNLKSSYSISLVDNGSNDGTFEYLRGIRGKNPIKFNVNLGVARAKNAGARDALGNPSVKYLCFLDNDTRVTEGWLDRMVDILEKNPKIAMVGPLSNNADGPQNLHAQPNPDKTLEQRDPEHILVDSINGFCMLVSADAIRKVGLFDESFGIYGFEEKDLCQRMRNSGYEIAIANRAYVEHRGRASVLENRLDWQKLITASSIKFSQKHAKPFASPEGTRSPPEAMKRFSGAKPRYSFVILVHNRLDMTKECIESIIETSQRFELVVVDNGSTDGSLDWIKARCPRAICIKNDKNLGVPIARNQGIKATTTEFAVIMDNDVILKQGWEDEMFSPFNNGADIVGIEGWQIDAGFAASRKCHASNERFDYLGGACTVFRRSVFERIGLLDEGFSPAYYEDVDICIRAKNGGFKLVWNPTNKIIHREHATLIHGQKDFKYQEALQNSHYRFARKMRREIQVEPEMLPPVAAKKYKILYLGMYHDYGVQGRGPSFEHNNFFPAFAEWERTKEMKHFDFVQLGKDHGLEKMSNMLYEEVQAFAPDALFGVWFDQNHDPKRQILQKISQTTPCKTVGWFCDSHWRYETFDKPWTEFLDFSVTTSQSGYEKYVRDGLKAKVIKSQWAAAPSYKNLSLPKDIEVSFIGQPHGDRRGVINQIRAAGIDIQVSGTGWGGSSQRLTFEQMVQVFNRSKINLNLNNACDNSFKQIKGRNFEVPGCGGFLLTGTAENLNEYYQYGKEIETYNDTNEMIAKIKHFLGQDDIRNSIATAGYNRTVNEHTYAHRFNEIFSTVFEKS